MYWEEIWKKTKTRENWRREEEFLRTQLQLIINNTHAHTHKHTSYNHSWKGQFILKGRTTKQHHLALLFLEGYQFPPSLTIELSIAPFSSLTTTKLFFSRSSILHQFQVYNIVAGHLYNLEEVTDPQVQHHLAPHTVTTSSLTACPTLCFLSPDYLVIANLHFSSLHPPHDPLPSGSHQFDLRIYEFVSVLFPFYFLS